jgi:hypothetical protein
MQFSNASTAVAAALSDTVNQPDGICEALYITTAGIIAGVDATGRSFQLTVPAGIFPLRVKRINSSVTTALNIFFLY